MPVPWIILVSLLWVVVISLAVMVAGLSSRLRQLATTAPAGHQPSSSHEMFVVGPPVDIQLALPPVLLQPEQGSADSGEILLFLHGSCGPCRLLWDQLAASDLLDQQLDGLHRQLITDEEGEAIFAGSLLTDIVVQHDDEISRPLGINASPYGIALDSDGFVRWSGVPHTVDDMLAMAKAIRRPREGLVHSVWSPSAPV